MNFDKKYLSQYMNYLVEQYKSSRGIKENIDINSQIFKLDFSIWLEERSLQTLQYANFICNMGVTPSIESSSIEIGKGHLDSIASDLNIPMITPYVDDASRLDALNAGFVVSNATPIAVTPSGKTYNCGEFSFANRYITQNPYTPYKIKNFNQLHNNGFNITVGVYGSQYDKDIDDKIRQIEELSKKLYGSECETNYDTYKDGYFYCVSSNRPVLVHKKKLY